MPSLGRRAIIWLCACSALAGCTVVDRFSDRVVTYNREAEQAQEQEILLNIIRASLRRPMQFTGLQTVTGSAQASVTPSLSVPFGGNRPRTLLSPNVFSLGGTMSGGPQFTVPILETQEFYQGILRPLSLQLFDFYLQQGFPKEILFDLFVSKIVVTQQVGDATLVRTYRNDTSDDTKFAQFQLLVEYLLGSGLSTESTVKSTQYGPPIPRAGLLPKDSPSATQMVNAYVGASGAGLELVADSSGDYRLEKKKSDYRFCFGQVGATAPPWLGSLDPSLLCGVRKEKSEASVTSGLKSSASGEALKPGSPPPEATAKGDTEDSGIEILGGVSHLQGVKLSQQLLDRLDALELRDTNAQTQVPFREKLRTESSGGAFVNLQMQIRSTEGIIYYLGEVTRRNLEPEREYNQSPRRVFQVKTALPFGALPSSDCSADLKNPAPHPERDMEWLDGQPRDAQTSNYYCENLFLLERSHGPNRPFLSVDYDGATYQVSDDAARAGRTYQVLELVKQLFALNTSAKEFPATNVLSVITAPQ